MEKSLAKSTEEFKKALKASERKVKELEKELHKEGRESSETSLLSQRLAAELDDEREQHQKDLSERDFAMDQTRKKYQGMAYEPFISQFSFLIANGFPKLQVNWRNSAKV
jgi:flagellar biosynthesis chaperone FliJ